MAGTEGPRSRGASATLIIDRKEPAEERSRGVLTIMSGPETGRVFPLPDVGMITLGRAPDCDLCFDEASVSGNHAQIARLGGVYVFVDSRSTNGSYVNDARAEAPAQLKDGDRIRLGSNAVLRFTLMNEKEEQALRSIYEAALRDGLTGVFNRKHLEERLDMELSFAKRHKVPLSVVMIDVDFFKNVNDTHGHLGGDEVLKNVGHLVAKAIRTEDMVARYGGEEFMIVARGTDLAQCLYLAERVRRIIERAVIAFSGKELQVTASLGVASLACCGQHQDKAALVSLADRRLYIAKQTGRNRVVSVG